MDENTKNGYTKEDYFTANKDMADYLRTEVSAVPPAEQERVNQVFEGIKAMFWRSMGNSCPRKQKTESKVKLKEY